MNRAATILALALVACSGAATPVDPVPATSPEPSCAGGVRLTLVPEMAGAGSEAYVCYGFDAGPLAGRAITGITWSAPTGGIALHHGVLFAAPDFPDGPVPCDQMVPEATPLHVWAPGEQPLVFPRDVGLALPTGTRRLVIQAHLLQLSQAPAGQVTATVCPAESVPAHLAGWFGAEAPVPAIRPHLTETSTGKCTLAAEVHLVFSWPHMHRIGSAFHGAIEHADGTRTSIVDLDSWDFDSQRMHAVDLVATPDDLISTTCVWQNPYDHYVLPGLHTSDEMCNQGLIGWPAEAARCTPVL